MRPWMFLKRLRWTSKLGLALLLVATTSIAQEGGKVDAEVNFRKTSQLSGAEQLAQAKQYLAKMKQVLGQVGKLAERARKEKDIIKLNCVNDKQIQIKGSLRVGESTNNELAAANSRSDVGARNHEFAKLTITYQKVTVLAQEAEACIGEEIAYVGKTRVDVQVDPDIDKQKDPTVEIQTVDLFRPPIASPFQ